MTFLRLRAAGLPSEHGSPTETIDLSTTTRRCKAAAGGFIPQPAEPFHASASVSFRWNPIESARTFTTEEDLVTELLGCDEDPPETMPGVCGPTSSSGRRCRKDPLYPRIARAMEQILARGKVVAPVDVLIRMDLLAPEHLEDWRRGRVPYLEKVIRCNLSRLSRPLRILRFHAHDLKLVPSFTAYTRWGKGPKERLRFTRTGAPHLEEAYARHFVRPGKGPFHPPAASREPRPNGAVPGRAPADSRSEERGT